MTPEQNLVVATCEAIRLGWLALANGMRGSEAIGHIAHEIENRFTTLPVTEDEFAINAYAYAVILEVLHGDVN